MGWLVDDGHEFCKNWQEFEWRLESVRCTDELKVVIILYDKDQVRIKYKQKYAIVSM